MVMQFFYHCKNGHIINSVIKKKVPLFRIFILQNTIMEPSFPVPQSAADGEFSGPDYLPPSGLAEALASFWKSPSQGHPWAKTTPLVGVPVRSRSPCRMCPTSLWPHPHEEPQACGPRRRHHRAPCHPKPGHNPGERACHPRCSVHNAELHPLRVFPGQCGPESRAQGLLCQEVKLSLWLPDGSNMAKPPQDEGKSFNSPAPYTTASPSSACGWERKIQLPPSKPPCGGRHGKD